MYINFFSINLFEIVLYGCTCATHAHCCRFSRSSSLRIGHLRVQTNDVIADKIVLFHLFCSLTVACVLAVNSAVFNVFVTCLINKEYF